MNYSTRFSYNGESFPANGYYPQKRVKTRDRVVKPRTDNQVIYMEAIEANDIVFCLGPAGTGKTHVAAGMAAKFFNRCGILDDPLTERRIIGVRPAIGDEDAKILPYLRPLLRELSKFIPPEELRKYRLGDAPRIELCPLQFMRGSTFEDAIVVFDEAQNATFSEMEMFMTRIGRGSKLIINGDVSQSDLLPHHQGALAEAAKMFADLPGVAVVTMSEEDAAVRHPLLPQIINKYKEKRMSN
jgi:phosphate starvation-inducible protein PhoH and related proteins